MISELLQGGFTAAIILVSVTLYLRFIDCRLMGTDRPISSELTINHCFRIFAAACIACGLVSTPAIFKLGLAGAPSELLFALLLLLIASLIMCFLAIEVFFTSIQVSGDTLITRTPLGQKQVQLSALTSVTFNDRFQVELSDARGTVRFCHYIEGKRALIEHIIEHAPISATWELRTLLTRM